MTQPPLHHIVRVRRSDDLTFVRPGVMDEILINANQLENSPDSTATALRQTTLPFTIDPVLWRFQIPERWRNDKGDTKKNYIRLGHAYVKGTGITIAAGPLLETIPSDAEWVTLARNVIAYQQNRLGLIPTQLDLLEISHPRELYPVRLMAPALVADSAAEDRINRLLAEASAAAANGPVAVSVIVPLPRLINPGELSRVIASIPTNAVSSYFIWTPNVTEEMLLVDHDLFTAVLRLISSLATRGIPVGHLHAGYAIGALGDVGISAVVHHLGWIDKGEPADDRRGGLRSCQIYVPGVRHCVRFDQARALGRSLDRAAYAERFCDCAFCTGSFGAGEHPLDVLLEEHVVPFKNGRDRTTPTGPAVTLNTWHYLLSRRLEVEAFSTQPAVDVIDRDIERAARLAGEKDTGRLRRLANEVRSA